MCYFSSGGELRVSPKFPMFHCKKILGALRRRFKDHLKDTLLRPAIDPVNWDTEASERNN